MIWDAKPQVDKKLEAEMAPAVKEVVSEVLEDIFYKNIMGKKFKRNKNDLRRTLDAMIGPMNRMEMGRIKKDIEQTLRKKVDPSKKIPDEVFTKAAETVLGEVKGELRQVVDGKKEIPEYVKPKDVVEKGNAPTFEPGQVAVEKGGRVSEYNSETETNFILEKINQVKNQTWIHGDYKDFESKLKMLLHSVSTSWDTEQARRNAVVVKNAKEISALEYVKGEIVERILRMRTEAMHTNYNPHTNEDFEKLVRDDVGDLELFEEEKIWPIVKYEPKSTDVVVHVPKEKAEESVSHGILVPKPGEKFVLKAANDNEEFSNDSGERVDGRGIPQKYIAIKSQGSKLDSMTKIERYNPNNGGGNESFHKRRGRGGGVHFHAPLVDNVTGIKIEGHSNKLIDLGGQNSNPGIQTSTIPTPSQPQGFTPMYPGAVPAAYPYFVQPGQALPPGMDQATYIQLLEEQLKVLKASGGPKDQGDQSKKGEPKKSGDDGKKDESKKGGGEDKKGQGDKKEGGDESGNKGDEGKGKGEGEKETFADLERAISEYEESILIGLKKMLQQVNTQDELDKNLSNFELLKSQNIAFAHYLEGISEKMDEQKKKNPKLKIPKIEQKEMMARFEKLRRGLENLKNSWKPKPVDKNEGKVGYTTVKWSYSKLSSEIQSLKREILNEQNKKLGWFRRWLGGVDKSKFESLKKKRLADLNFKLQELENESANWGDKKVSKTINVVDVDANSQIVSAVLSQDSVLEDEILLKKFKEKIPGEAELKKQIAEAKHEGDKELLEQKRYELMNLRVEAVKNKKRVAQIFENIKAKIQNPEELKKYAVNIGATALVGALLYFGGPATLPLLAKMTGVSYVGTLASLATTALGNISSSLALVAAKGKLGAVAVGALTAGAKGAAVGTGGAMGVKLYNKLFGKNYEANIVKRGALGFTIGATVGALVTALGPAVKTAVAGWWYGGNGTGASSSAPAHTLISNPPTPSGSGAAQSTLPPTGPATQPIPQPPLAQPIPTNQPTIQLPPTNPVPTPAPLPPQPTPSVAPSILTAVPGNLDTLIPVTEVGSSQELFSDLLKNEKSRFTDLFKSLNSAQQNTFLENLSGNLFSENARPEVKKALASFLNIDENQIGKVEMNKVIRGVDEGGKPFSLKKFEAILDMAYDTDKSKPQSFFWRAMDRARGIK